MYAGCVGVIGEEVNLILTCLRNSHSTTMMHVLANYYPAVPIQRMLDLVTASCITPISMSFSGGLCCEGMCCLAWSYNLLEPIQLQSSDPADASMAQGPSRWPPQSHFPQLTSQ